ncbi:MAG: hypothetical protein C1O27_001338 [Chloroflexi bacterium]|jgi:hypothetical protein|nr:MAG: hypothetical protein C1O27_001338 [Chloroflexota bacterium]
MGFHKSVDGVGKDQWVVAVENKEVLGIAHDFAGGSKGVSGSPRLLLDSVLDLVSEGMTKRFVLGRDDKNDGGNANFLKGLHNPSSHLQTA